MEDKAPPLYVTTPAGTFTTHYLRGVRSLSVTNRSSGWEIQGRHTDGTLLVVYTHPSAADHDLSCRLAAEFARAIGEACLTAISADLVCSIELANSPDPRGPGFEVRYEKGVCGRIF